MDKAFVLGAGLGTRLRPLTDQLPKPLIPFFHRPLITRAFDHLLRAGVREFIVNTHHLPGRYAETFPRNEYRGARITFRHEPVLLETAGGIANIADLVGNAPFLVYNGDILSDLPLAPLMKTHAESGNLVTLVLRSDGAARHIAFDPGRGLVTDIRGKLGTGNEGTHQFTGIYAVSPAFLRHLTPGRIESVVRPWLEAIRQGGRIGAVVVDEGHWWDLGARESYLDAHRAFPSPDAPAVSPEAAVDRTVTLKGLNLIPATAVVGAGAVLEDCILWDGARVAAGARLRRCIVRGGMEAQGVLENCDI
jgi:mannose-1-phosphate guanylyltransferase/mannose-1-phosphate guanylyltransferase/phosphomannomutase